MTALTWAASTGLPVELRIAVRHSSPELYTMYLVLFLKELQEYRQQGIACFVAKIILI